MFGWSHQNAELPQDFGLTDWGYTPDMDERLHLEDVINDKNGKAVLDQHRAELKKQGRPLESRSDNPGIAILNTPPRSPDWKRGYVTHKNYFKE